MLSEKAKIEYKKWAELVAELTFLGVDINMAGKLSDALRSWVISFHEAKLENPAFGD